MIIINNLIDYNILEILISSFNILNDEDNILLILKTVFDLINFNPNKYIPLFRKFDSFLYLDFNFLKNDVIQNMYESILFILFK